MDKKKKSWEYNARGAKGEQLRVTSGRIEYVR